MNMKEFQAAALSIRALSIDAIQKANSGHPGLPMGCAELAALLYGEVMKHDPSAPSWIDRDRFVLSAGHGSMLLYASLHLAGYGVSLDDIKRFRQLGSPCAGHPEYGMAPGIETTTGPLGQGLATAVGMALAEKMLAARFNDAEARLFDHYTYVLAGDGCLQEGVASEASSLAGHWGLGKLIVFYDSNSITIDGGTDLSFSEDVAKRYEAYGWQVLKGDMYDAEGVLGLIAKAKADAERPSIIILKSIIGKGSPKFQGTSKAHGAPLGADEVIAARKTLGIPEGADFYIADGAKSFFEPAAKRGVERKAAWQAAFEAWRKRNPAKAAELDACLSGALMKEAAFPTFKPGESIATRTASGKILAALCEAMPALVGGSADLTGPNATQLPGNPYSKANPSGRMIHYGVREFGMAAITNGLALHGGLRPFCATFMVFSDYLRPALRLSALMRLPVIYVLTHDSIYLGEDGPTHQPIEHLASLRAVPGLRVLRPADAEEAVACYELALAYREGPSAIALSRQNLPVLAKADPEWRETVKTGAYVALNCQGAPDAVIVATGSEVATAMEAAKLLDGMKVRVVSMPCRELFLSQPDAIKDAIVPKGAKLVVAEAGSSLGWEKLGEAGVSCLSIERFGESGPGNDVAAHFGFSPESLAKLVRA
jgi:transketolase